MVQEEEKTHHLSTIITNSEFELQGMKRRDFIIYLSLLPIATFPSKSNAIFHMIPIAIRLFGRPLWRYAFKKFSKPTGIMQPKFSGSRAIAIEKAIKANNRKNDLAHTGVFLADQLWKQGGKNTSSTIIMNTSNEFHNTGDITVQLRDEDTAHVDVQATIQSLKVPPESKLLLQMNFSNLPNEGVKRLHGVYNEQQNAKHSGRILVARNTGGTSINELYRKYNRKYDGGVGESYTF